MGTGASTQEGHQPSSKFLQAQVEHLKLKELQQTEHLVKQSSDLEEKINEEIRQLQNQNDHLREKLRATERRLEGCETNLKEEKDKSLSLMLNELPLAILKGMVPNKDGVSGKSLCTSYPMITVMQCNVVGFSTLISTLSPTDAVFLVNEIQHIIEESTNFPDVFIPEHSPDGCVAACGVSAEASMQSMSKKDLMVVWKQNASCMADTALKLLSLSVNIKIPSAKCEEHKLPPEKRQLQLRIALHSGPCIGGIIGLKEGLNKGKKFSVMRYQLLGKTLEHVHNLCYTGLALQIRASKACHDLLLSSDYVMEKCPDFCTEGNIIESYWIVKKKGLSYRLPSLEDAISLSEYSYTAQF